MRRDLMAAMTIPPAEAGDIVVRFGGSPADWWPGPTRRNAKAWQVEVRLGRLRRPVIATIGDCWVDGLTTWRSLSWTPVRMLDGRLQPDPRLPGFTGSLGLRRPDDRPAVLLLQGVYDPPGGRLGSALDDLLLHTVAARTAQQLLGDIREHLQSGDQETQPPPVAADEHILRS
ncbi:MAG TPA: hypothetical protein VMM13_15965 [Euzebya sp.]|nr:hypothetical protein [Euzebya sp.]